jgi:hypothetical protein
MTTRRLFAKSILGAALAVSLGSAALAQPMPAYPPGWRAPPPPRVEVVPLAPGAAYAWVPGHWRWTGSRYVWVRGHYAIREAGWHHWVDGHWAVIAGRWAWIPGHWS